VINIKCIVSILSRHLIRHFLCFDMSNDLEIYLQDKMINGQIEASRAEIFVPPAYVNSIAAPAPASKSSEVGDFTSNMRIVDEIPEGLIIKSPEKKKKWGIFSSHSFPSNGKQALDSTAKSYDQSCLAPFIDQRVLSIVFSVKNKHDWRDLQSHEWSAENNAAVFASESTQGFFGGAPTLVSAQDCTTSKSSCILS